MSDRLIELAIVIACFLILGYVIAKSGVSIDTESPE